MDRVNIKKQEKSRYYELGSWLAGLSLLLVLLILPICQVTGNHAGISEGGATGLRQYLNWNDSDCCSLGYMSADYLHHLGYFKFIFLQTTAPGTMLTAGGWLVLLLVFSFYRWQKFKRSKGKNNLLSFSPEIALFPILKLIYAQGIIQNKHLD